MGGDGRLCESEMLREFDDPVLSESQMTKDGEPGDVTEATEDARGSGQCRRSRRPLHQGGRVESGVRTDRHVTMIAAVAERLGRPVWRCPARYGRMSTPSWVPSSRVPR